MPHRQHHRRTSVFAGASAALLALVGPLSAEEVATPAADAVAPEAVIDAVVVDAAIVDASAVAEPGEAVADAAADAGVADAIVAAPAAEVAESLPEAVVIAPLVPLGDAADAAAAAGAAPAGATVETAAETQSAETTPETVVSDAPVDAAVNVADEASPVAGEIVDKSAIAQTPDDASVPEIAVPAAVTPEIAVAPEAPEAVEPSMTVETVAESTAPAAPVTVTPASATPPSVTAKQPAAPTAETPAAETNVTEAIVTEAQRAEAPPARGDIADDLNASQQLEQGVTLTRTINGEVIEEEKRTIVYPRNTPARVTEASLTPLERIKQAFDGEVLTRNEAFEEAKLDFTLGDANRDDALTVEEFKALHASWREQKTETADIARALQYEAVAAESAGAGSDPAADPDAVAAKLFATLAGASATVSRKDYIAAYLVDFDAMDADRDTLLRGEELLAFRKMAQSAPAKLETVTDAVESADRE